MDQLHYKEMKRNLQILLSDGAAEEKEIYIFGHCNASEELANLLIDDGYQVSAILDNNPAKQGAYYKKIPILPPQVIQKRDMKHMLICIVSRACEAMVRQLKEMGYSGRLEKLVDYNTFAEYSLSPETIARKKERVKRGVKILKKVRNTHLNCFFIICPFSALGDVYYAMAYLPGYLIKRQVRNYTVIAVGRTCADVALMFGCPDIEILSQKDMDELVQAVLFIQAGDAFIAHHDRPYPNLLMKALYVKMIPFETLYRCGVFGLEREYKPCEPEKRKCFSAKDSMERGRTVILSPYAKSVAGIDDHVWEKIVSWCKRRGCQIYTNVVGEEKALAGTLPLRVSIMELQSAVEWAGTFIGVRSGLCDIIRNASCRKIVLFPDCYYSDTRWKAADFFYLEGWENMIVQDGCFTIMEEYNEQ